MPYFANEGHVHYMPQIPPDYPSRYGGGYAASLAAPANPYSNFNHVHQQHGLGPILPDPFDQFKNGPAPMSAYEAGAAFMNGQSYNSGASAYMSNGGHRSSRWPSSQSDYQNSRHSSRNVQRHREKEEKPVGGVSAKLDYEMEQMTDFVTEMTVRMYDFHTSRICIADIDIMQSIKPGATISPSFRKWVLQVLNATRLPSATILLSLSYLALRVRKISDAGVHSTTTDASLYQMLTVALILGSKFLDDNTFQNKSWAEVSSISVVELNRDEREWLSSFEHRLHYDPDCPAGFNSWLEQWSSFKARTSPASNNAATSSLHPIDTSVRRQRSFPNNLSAPGYNQFYGKQTSSGATMDHMYPESAYPASNYPSYEGWYGSRQSERSPSTAPHSGPHTPEYYGQQSMWNYDGYAHRHSLHYPLPSISAYPQQHPSNAATYPSGWNLPSFNATAQGYWNCHGAACQCGSCRASHNSFPSRYGSVVG